MREFIKNLLSGKSDTSSKRFAALFTLMNLLVLAYMAAMRSNGITPEFMFNGLLLIVGGGLGLSVVEKIFNKNATSTTTVETKETPEETTTTVAQTTEDKPLADQPVVTPPAEEEKKDDEETEEGK